MDNATMELRKALATTGSGANLIPEVVSEGLRNYVETRSPLYSIMPKIDWPTNSYIFRSRSAGPSAFFAADGAALDAATQSTYAKTSVAMKYVYARGEVTGPMQKAAGSLFNALQLEIEAQADELVRELELTIIGGDEGTDADEFDGLVQQITNAKAGGSVALTLAMMDEALDIPAEYPTHIVMSRAHGRRLWSLLQAQQRFIDRIEVGAGFRVPAYNELPVIRVDNDADTDLATTILMPDFRHIVMPINEHITYEPLAKTKDSDDFMIKQYCTLAVEGAARYHSSITAVTAA